MNIKKLKKKHGLKYQWLNKEKGASLLEVMAGLGILGISTVATTSQLKNVNNHFRKYKIMHAYSSISSEIGRTVSNINTVLDSLDKSPNKSGQKYQCIKGAVNSARNCTHDSGPWGFVLYRPGTNIAIAGSSKNNPVYYDSSGKLCDNSENRCFLRAYTSLRPHCLNEASNCFSAQSLSVKYIVEINDSVSGGLDYFVDKGWIDHGKKNIMLQNSFETNLQTNLVPLLDQGSVINCNVSDFVLQGVSLRLEPICVKFTPPTKGPIGDQGDSIKGDTGSRGKDAKGISENEKEYLRK